MNSRGFTAAISASLICTLCLVSRGAAQPSITAKFQFRTHAAAGINLPYRLFVPENTVPGVRYPIVLALHGAGERGTDNRLQIEANRLATSWADPVHQSAYPCFVVAPQCPPGEGWSGSSPLSLPATARAALDMLDSLIREFPVDTNRQYVTGLSMGGFGTWALIINDPGRFAAAVPVCGGEDPAWASRLADIPIWNFHGARDDQVPVAYSRSMIEALEAQGRDAVYTHCRYLDCSGLPDSVVALAIESGADLLYTEYETVGHNAWDFAYEEPRLVPWVFGFTRRVPDAITLTSLQAPSTLSGDVQIDWATAAPGDSVELWFSSDAGERWRALSEPVPNGGLFMWHTDSVDDCVFGMVRAVLRTAGGLNAGSDESASLVVNNAMDGPPSVRILNPEFYTDPLFDQDSIDLRLVLGDPEGGDLSVNIVYSGSQGSASEGVAAFQASGQHVERLIRIGLAGLANSDHAVIRAVVSDGASFGFAGTTPFAKRTPRVEGPSAVHLEGSSGAEVRVHIVDPSMLTGHTYRVLFNSEAGSATTYDVRDVTASATILVGVGILDGTTEGPAFDGIRLVVRDRPLAAVDADSSGWVTGLSTLGASIFVPDRNVGGVQYAGFPYPYDYLITLADLVVDTSIAGFGLDAIPIRFSVQNLTLATPADVAFFDGDGDGAISSLDEVDILESDSLGERHLSWAVFFAAEVGDTLPLPGDQFLLRTLKPLTSADVYEFSTVTAVAQEMGPAAFRLEQNYPNPFNGETTIRYAVGAGRAEPASRSHVRIVVYDLLGREVLTIVDGHLPPGSYETRFAPAGIASGLYFYRLSVDGNHLSRKMLYLR